jgi:WD40 repeat protein
MRPYLIGGRLRFVATGVLLACGLQLLPAQGRAQQAHLRATLVGDPDEVLLVAFSPDGKTLASGSCDAKYMTTVKLWDVATGQSTSEFRGPVSETWCSVAFSPDGKKLACGDGGNRIRLWDLATGNVVLLLDFPSEYARPNVVFSPDGKTLASGGRCLRDIQLFDVAAEKSVATLKGHDEYGITALRFSADGKTLTSAGVHGGIKLWDANADKEPISHLTEWKKFFYSTAISPDCALVAAVNKNYDLELWDVTTGQKRDVKFNNAGAKNINFSPDGSRLASWGMGNAIKIWDVATGSEVDTLEGHTDNVLSVAFSPDGTTLASCGTDTTIKLWDLPMRQ